MRKFNFEAISKGQICTIWLPTCGGGWGGRIVNSGAAHSTCFGQPFWWHCEGWRRRRQNTLRYAHFHFPPQARRTPRLPGTGTGPPRESDCSTKSVQTERPRNIYIDVIFNWMNRPERQPIAISSQHPTPPPPPWRLILSIFFVAKMRFSVRRNPSHTPLKEDPPSSNLSNLFTFP